MVKYNWTCIGWVRLGRRGGSSVNTSGPRVQGWNFNGVLYHDALRFINNESTSERKRKEDIYKMI